MNLAVELPASIADGKQLRTLQHLTSEAGSSLKGALQALLSPANLTLFAAFLVVGLLLMKPPAGTCC